MSELRGRAWATLLVIAGTLVLSLVLLVAFDPGVQTLDAEELVAERDDARAFLIPDFAFAALYGLVAPVVLWRFGAALYGLVVPNWVKAAALLLALAGLVDLVENVLLYSATDAVSEDAVDTAHAIKPVALVAFPIGALLSFVLGWRAVQTLRRGEPEGDVT